jgi:hypothetical protein
LPQRFASIDVADARGDALVQEELTDGDGTGHRPSAAHDVRGRPVLAEDVGAKVIQRRAFGAHDLDQGR